MNQLEIRSWDLNEFFGAKTLDGVHGGVSDHERACRQNGFTRLIAISSSRRWVTCECDLHLLALVCFSFQPQSIRMSTTTIDRIRQQVSELDQYDLPENFRDETPKSKTAVVDGALLERYVNLRDDYLKKSIDNTMAKHIPTFDGENFHVPESAIDDKELEDKKQIVQSKLQQLNRDVQTNWDQLQADFSRLQERKEDLRKMLEQYEGDGASLNLENEDDEEPVEEEDLQAQQERLLALQQRKKDLLSKLHRLQEEHRDIQIASTEAEASLIVRSHDTETIAEMEKENKILLEKISANKEMSSYFETMRLVTEELSGVRILAVEEGNSEDVDVLLQLEILHSHQVEIGLQADSQHKEGLRVASARLLSPSVVQLDIPTDYAATIDLRIPDLEDLVMLAQPQPRTKALAFVIQETIARIEMTNERAEELRLIYQDESFHIEKSVSSSNSYGRCDHEVIVTLPEFDVKVLLRMTPDCPRLPGSTFLDQISGPNPDDLKPTLQSSRRMKAKRPITLLRTLKKRLSAEN